MCLAVELTALKVGKAGIVAWLQEHFEVLVVLGGQARKLIQWMSIKVCLSARNSRKESCCSAEQGRVRLLSRDGGDEGGGEITGQTTTAESDTETVVVYKRSSQKSLLSRLQGGDLGRTMYRCCIASAA